MRQSDNTTNSALVEYNVAVLYKYIEIADGKISDTISCTAVVQGSHTGSRKHKQLEFRGENLYPNGLYVRVEM